MVRGRWPNFDNTFWDISTFWYMLITYFWDTTFWEHSGNTKFLYVVTDVRITRRDICKMFVWYCQILRVHVHGLYPWPNLRKKYKYESKASGPLTGCKPNVDQEEWPCTQKWMCWFFLNICPKSAILKKKKFEHSLHFSCLHFSSLDLSSCFHLELQQA